MSGNHRCKFCGSALEQPEPGANYQCGECGAVVAPCVLERNRQ